ncbi:MAG TPA: cysteine desulfurase-like protein [Anaerolineae bacterium]
MDIQQIRSHFPSLKSGAIFLDNPAGTQVSQGVIDAMTDYYLTSNSNSHGAFLTSRRTDETVGRGRAAFADFFNARSPDEIAFGPNMTTLTFSLSRALGRTIQPGDEIIVTRLDHDANISPWLALAERGAVIKWVDIDPEDCTLDQNDFEKQLSHKTKIVAVGYASNATGTINPIKAMIDLAHMAGALVFVDAVHAAPHVAIDVQELNCDFLACSAYKFYGPHLGVLYGKREWLDRLTPYKVRPASNDSPDKFETGTANFEGIAGATAAVDYLAWVGKELGNKGTIGTEGTEGTEGMHGISARRMELVRAMSVIKTYESQLCARLLRGLLDVKGIEIYGITDFDRLADRAPTIALNLQGHAPGEIAKKLGEQNIYVWDGNYYALAVMERLGLEGRGGAVRVGLAHYNTAEEVDRLLDALKRM